MLDIVLISAIVSRISNTALKPTHEDYIMICYVTLTDYRTIKGVINACENTFAVKALSTKHALKKSINHLWKQCNIQDVDHASATTDTGSTIDSHVYPLVTINSAGIMKGKWRTRYYTV